MRRTLAIGCAVSALLLTACAGPKAPLHVGTQAAPVNLVLGEHKAVEEAPVGPLTDGLPPGLAPFLPTPLAPPPTAPPAACPDFDPLDPAIATVGTVVTPPAPATYTYRTKTADTLADKTSSY
ncbi:MAG TPA: hypothetical protein VHD87_11840, partial [Acidimicrobiales bacterium]|nr:hypothetical protein [Acidimicrobiales bacterium]